MIVLLLSNMYPRNRSQLGVFVKKQEDALVQAGVSIHGVVRRRITGPGYLVFQCDPPSTSYSVGTISYTPTAGSIQRFYHW